MTALSTTMTAQATSISAQATAAERQLAEATRLRETRDETACATAAAATVASTSVPLAVFSGIPVTTRTINHLQTVGRTVISRMERASIVDRDQLDKISKKIRRAIAPGFLYIDINKLLESATRSAIIQPIQLLQDLYIELNNSLAKTKSNKIFYIIDWDVTGAITRSTNMITHHVPNLMAHRVIENTMQMIQCVSGSGSLHCSQ
jgi:hypothetical protein